MKQENTPTGGELESNQGGLAEGVGKEETIYTQRFSPEQEKARAHTWEILCRDFFQRYIKNNDCVVDVGAGDGLFITNINAARRIAVDLSPHVNALKTRGVEVLQIPATELNRYFKGDVDVIFMSNFLEHLPDKKVLLEVLSSCREALKAGGKVLILQPNVRYVGAAYWDYIDHHIALTESSLREALDVSGFAVIEMIPRFLPYTVKSRIGKFSALTGIYLKLSFLWRFFGQQTFVVATPARKK